MLLKKNAESLLAAIAGFCIIILFTHHGGIGLSPDSVVYSSVAENIRLHAALRDYSQKTIVNFPVCYPAMLSLVSSITGLNPFIFAPLMNALLFATVIFLSGLMMDNFASPARWYKIAILSCIVFSPCLLEVYSMLWSETLFLIWLLLFFVALHHYLQKLTASTLLMAAITAGLAAVTRYAGITLIATGGLMILLNSRLTLKKRILPTLMFSFVSSTLLLINLIRNYYVSGTLMGIREKAIRTLSENMHDTGTVFCDWLPFLNGHYSAAIIITCILITLSTFLWIWQQLSKETTTYEHIACSFFLLYFLFMLISSSTSRYEQLNSRLLSPLFIPFLWIGSNWIIRLIKKLGDYKKPVLLMFALALFACFQFTQLKADYETWDGVKDAGIPGYTEDEWKKGETILYIQKNISTLQKEYTIYSDADDAVYFFTGRQSLLLPHKDFSWEKDAFLKNQHCYVIWFNVGENTDLVDLHFITEIKKMKLLKTFSDGAIYITEN